MRRVGRMPQKSPQAKNNPLPRCTIVVRHATLKVGVENSFVVVLFLAVPELFAANSGLRRRLFPRRITKKQHNIGEGASGHHERQLVKTSELGPNWRCIHF